MAEIAVKSSKESVPSARPAGGRAPAPWEAWDALRDQMDRMFNTFMRGFPSLPSFRPSLDFEPSFRFDTSFGMAVPAVDVVEKDDAFVVSAELPGLEEKDIAVEVHGNVVSLKGEKKSEHDERKAGWHWSERSYGSFRRVVELPVEVEADKASASFKNGVLTITLPKAESAMVRHIPVQSA